MKQASSAQTQTPEDAEGPESASFAQLLAQAAAGEATAWNRIYALLYADLHRIARSQIRRHAGPRVSPTSLISETWLKLSGASLNVLSRRHLTALIARAMRFVLIDETRRALSGLAGAGEGVHLLETLTDPAPQARLEQLLALNQALDSLAGIDRRLAEVVELRYFGGLSEPEAAEVLGVTARTISRDWRKARAFLLARLGRDGLGGI